MVRKLEDVLHELIEHQVMIFFEKEERRGERNEEHLFRRTGG
jgi:hypothetical protein